MVALLVIGAFLAAPWQIAVAAQAGLSPVIEAADDHAGHAAAGHVVPDDDGAAASNPDEADHTAHRVPCCKGICLLCPGLTGKAQDLLPPGWIESDRLALRLSLLIGLLPEIRPHPPKLS